MKIPFKSYRTNMIFKLHTENYKAALFLKNSKSNDGSLSLNMI